MKLPLRRAASCLLLLVLSSFCFASAYNARPKLIVVIVIDQFRGDYLERHRDQFGEGGFRLFLDHGANFTDCYYNHANTSTAPGHAALLTGAYPRGNGILGNEWWDTKKKALVTSVEDDSTQLVGVTSKAPGASPHNLMASGLGDQLRLATQGKSRVFGISFKDRGAVLPAGFSGNGAYWIDHQTGVWITSTYYRSELPKWVQDFNGGGRPQKYLNLEWKDSNGKVFRTTTPGKTSDFYGLVGSTPLGNEYEFEFARELITYEKLGSSGATDLLVISLSSNDTLGHQVGPDAPEINAMTLALDRQLAGFFEFLGKQFGLANVWLALSADHGVAPTYTAVTRLHIPSVVLDVDKLADRLNHDLAARLHSSRQTRLVNDADNQAVWINQAAFASLKMNEDQAEQAVGEALKREGYAGYYTRSQLARGDVPNDLLGRRYANNYSPYGGWYVLCVPPPFSVTGKQGAEHGSPYSYDAHVPLAFYGLPFQPGTYREEVEPIDLAPTLASLLGINAPTHSVGRVLTEALSPPRTGDSH